MKKSTRILLATIGVEVFIVLIGAWLLNGLANGSLHPAGSVGETSATIRSVLGTAMGVITGVMGVTWFVVRKREKDGQ